LIKPHINNLNGNLIPPEILSNNFQVKEIADLNEVLRFVLDKYTSGEDKNFIFRLDKMPLVFGNKEQYACLFDTLMSMIISHPPVNSKLFLYVKCAEEKQDDDVIDLQLTEENPFCKIDIYSNINTDKDWEASYQRKLAECALQASKIRGSFSFFPISNTGCLFSVTLPVKNN
jgi:hypothetical protein